MGEAVSGLRETAEAACRILLGGGRLQLRGNCHCHTTCSDGAYPPAEAVARYCEAGHDFVYLTDHCDKLDRGRLPDFEALDSPEFRVLPGIEYRCVAVRRGQKFQVHILGLDTLDLSHWKPGIHEQETIDGINRDGGTAVLAHPYWNARTIEDLAGLRGAGGIELFNASVDSVNAKGLAVTHWEQMLESGLRLWGLAVDDLHADPGRPADFALGWIVVSAEEKTPPAIADAVRSGSFYASCGPDINEWSIQGNCMSLRCSPVQTIAFSSAASRGRIFRDSEGGLLTEAHLPLDGFLPGTDGPQYIRASCCDEQGRWAWTNPVWADGSFMDNPGPSG